MGRSSALASASQIIRSQSKMGNRASSRAQSKLGSQQFAVRAQSKLGNPGQGVITGGQNDRLGGRISEIEEEDDDEVIRCKITTSIYVVQRHSYTSIMSHCVFILTFNSSQYIVFYSCPFVNQQKKKNIIIKVCVS